MFDLAVNDIFANTIFGGNGILTDPIVDDIVNRVAAIAIAVSPGSSGNRYIVGLDAAASLRPEFEYLYVGDLDLDLAGPPVAMLFGVFPKHPLLAGFICRLRDTLVLEVCDETDRIYNPQRRREIIF